MAERALVFDLDDTLYPERQYVRGGYRVIADVLRGQYRTQDRYEDWLWERFRAGKASGAFDALSKRFDLELSEKQIADLVATYRGHRPTLQARDGMTELLGAAGRQARLGLLSDGFLPAQQYKLEALRLRPAFDQVVFTEQLGRAFWKPAPEGFQLMTELLGVEHEACTYIADNLAKDFVAPNRLGWRTVLLRCDDQVHRDNTAPDGGGPHVTVDGVARLRALLID